MKRFAVLALISLLLLSSLALLPAPAGAAEIANTPQWVLVQNLTFDDIKQINALYVKGDATNLSVAIENGMLNISVKSKLTKTTNVYFLGFAPGPSKWVMRYETAGISLAMKVDNTQLWSMKSLKIIHSDGTSSAIGCHDPYTMQTTTIVFNNTGHVWVYKDSAEQGNDTTYSEGFYYIPYSNIIDLVAQEPVISFFSGASPGAYVTFDYIAQYKKMSEYMLDVDYIFFNRWDDARDNFFENGFKLFKQHGFYGMMSVITGQANWTNIHKLSDAGWELSDHTRDHIYLTTLPLADAKAEIANGKADLQAHGYTVIEWTPPGGASNSTLYEYAYSELGLRPVYMIYTYGICNDKMTRWNAWASWSERYGATTGHEVRDDVTAGSVYITTQNLSKVVSDLEKQKLFVLGFSQIWDIALNQAYGTITRTVNTDTEKRFSISGPGQWAEVAVKGDYTGDLWKVQDEHGRNLWHFYKDGYTYILVKLDATKADYSGVVKITYEASASAGGTGSTGWWNNDILKSAASFIIHHILTIVFIALALLSLLARNWKLFVIFALLAVASYFVVDSYISQWFGGG